MTGGGRTGNVEDRDVSGDCGEADGAGGGVSSGDRCSSSGLENVGESDGVDVARGIGSSSDDSSAGKEHGVAATHVFSRDDDGDDEETTRSNNRMMKVESDGEGGSVDVQRAAASGCCIERGESVDDLHFHATKGGRARRNVTGWRKAET